jgi:myosin heavy subunit
MDEDELQKFLKNMKALEDDEDLVGSDHTAEEQYRATLDKYQRWRKVVSERMDDLRDYSRMTSEAAELEKETSRLQDDIGHYQATLKDQRGKEAEVLSEKQELDTLAIAAKGWSGDATRIAEKRMQISQKNLDLTATATATDNTRDLRTVEREVDELSEEKDNLSNKINRLNKEMTNLNTRFNQLSTQVSSTSWNEPTFDCVQLTRLLRF